MTTTFDTLRMVAGKLPPLDERESTDDFLRRLVLAVSSMPIPAFDKLPSEAREWFNAAADALSAGLRVPEPDGFDREAALAPPPPLRIARPSGSAYIPAKLTYKSTPAIAPQPGQEPTRMTVIKLMVADPDLSADDLIRRLADHHVKMSNESAQSARGWVVSVLRVVREAGWRPPA